MNHERFVSRHHPLLGTVVEVSIIGLAEPAARAINNRVVDEIDRLEQIFSMYRNDSELSRWKRDELNEPSPEFCDVMDAALVWQARSNGSFNPLAGSISRLWAAAESTGTMPSDDELAATAAAIAEPRYAIVDGVPVASGDCTDLNLNAIAKGYIVDRALGLAAPDLLSGSIVVSAGGDMAHVGHGPVTVGIENPLRPYDNEPPVGAIELHNAGLATSGGARRGFQVVGRRLSHALDARTGRPVEAQAAISVVAPDAMTADAIATVAGALAPPEAVALVDSMPGVSCLVIDPSGVHHANRSWGRLATDVN